MKMFYTIAFLFLYVISMCQTQMTEGLFTDMQLINPASVGWTSNTNLNLHVGTQWLTFGSESPKTSIVDYNSRISSRRNRRKIPTNHAFGVQLSGERSGNYYEFRANGTYAYHVKINPINHLSLGIRTNISNGYINLNNIVLHQANDPLLNTQQRNSVNADFDFGALFYKEDKSGESYNFSQADRIISYYVGFSSNKLLNTNNAFYDNNKDNFSQRKYNLIGGIKTSIHRYYYLRGTINVNSTGYKLLSFYNIESSVGYKTLEMGFGYSTHTIKSFFAANLPQLNIKYSVFYSTGPIRSVSAFSHTVSLGIYLFQ